MATQKPKGQQSKDEIPHAQAGGKMNRSQAIRDAMKVHPQAKPKELVEILAKQGVRVKQNLVYMVKGQMAQKKSQRKHHAARVARASEKTGIGDPVALVVKVKELAREAGGIDNLKTLVGVLAD